MVYLKPEYFHLLDTDKIAPKICQYQEIVGLSINLKVNFMTVLRNKVWGVSILWGLETCKDFDFLSGLAFSLGQLNLKFFFCSFPLLLQTCPDVVKVIKTVSFSSEKDKDSQCDSISPISNHKVLIILDISFYRIQFYNETPYLIG